MENEILSPEIKIENKILVIRGIQVMLDCDLAELYGVGTKRLNEQVRRNIERFPANFMFQLNHEEFEFLRSQFATSKIETRGGRQYLPYVFTKQGVAMLASVLKSKTARYKIEDKQGIFFQGQIFDAYAKFESFIQSAENEIVLIDNYVDLSVLERLTKKQKDVKVTIYTDPKTKLNEQDILKFNEQYPQLAIKHTSKVHDRFLIIDNSTLYHIGASLKDLGKKCFAFEVLDSVWIKEILKNL